MLVFGLGCLLLRGVWGAEPRLSPAHWPAADREKYALLNLIYDLPRPLAEADKAMIAGTSGPLAIHSGLVVLKQGGTAADAAIATSLAQIVLTAGAWNSFAGIYYLVYYERASDKVYCLNAGYNTVLGETEPLTIPRRPEPSGRTALVPGFMRGIEATHRRFGRMPLAKLFDAAIFFAERGFVIDSVLGRMMTFRKDVLTRLPETQAVFTKPNGELYREGEHFRQPQLARTLRRVAQDGADHMYTGPWATKFVEAVRGEGGKMSLADLRRYRAGWQDALSTTHGDYEVHTVALPELGGLQVVEALNILELSRLKERGHYTASPDALYWFIQICRLGPLVSYYHPAAGAGPLDDALPPQHRIRKDAAAGNWARLQVRGWQNALYKTLTGDGGHSDGVVAVDADGNVAALVHSINTTAWGTTGIFVDGVSVPDSASFQQQRVAKVGPGVPFPNIVNPVIVLADGRPILAASCIGAALHRCMLQNLVNVLDFGMDPKTSVETPGFWGPVPARAGTIGGSGAYYTEMVRKGRFSASHRSAVKELGQPLQEMDEAALVGKAAFWVGIQVGRQNRKLRGSVASKLNGIAEGH